MEDKIDKLQNKIGWHQYCIDKLQNNINTLYAKILQKRINTFFDSGVLNNSQWVLNTSTDSSFINIGRTSQKIEKKINEIMKPSWNESITLQPGITLRFDDGEVCIEFKSPEICKAFINKNKIIINVEQHTKLINSLKTKIDIIETAINSTKC